MASTGPSIPQQSPEFLRDELVRSLQAFLDYTDTDEYMLDLEEMDEEQRKEAVLTRGKTYRAWRGLNNARLDDIRTRLVEHESDILSTTRDLNASLAGVQNVASVLQNTNHVLSVAARLVTFV